MNEAKPASRAFEEYAADGVLVLGGAAAILLQLGDPVVARGVAGHSSFATDPMRRMRTTLSYLYAVSLGTVRQSERMAGLVDRAHDGVPGSTDPDRQLWVAATLYRVGVDVHDLVRGPLSAALGDEVYTAFERVGTALQLPPGTWPADRAAFEGYWTDAIAALQVTEPARAVARDLLWPRMIPWWTRPAMPLVRTVTTGLLPEPVRAAYGLAWHPRRFRAAICLVRVLAAVAPRRIRELPARTLLARIPAR